MSLLPKTRDDFKKTDYWNKFFQKRGSKSFEWYGEYNELKTHLHKYILKQDTLLVIGCGNSSLSGDLYDSGIKNIINIDISKICIKQMQNVNRERAQMQFIQMDATKMSQFNDMSYSTILDKGTLDALMPDNNDDTLTKVNCMFAEINRLLKIGGRYICISLLQQHIFKHLLFVFSTKYGWIVRVIRCLESEIKASASLKTTQPVFMIVCTKMKSVMMIPIIEMVLNGGGGGGQMERVNCEQALKDVYDIQTTALICAQLSRTHLSNCDEIVLDLFAPDNDKQLRYTVHVLDQQQVNRQRTNGCFAVFIVPQGRETEWLFATVDGRQKLLAEANNDRLAIVTMHRGQRYGTMDDVKMELNDNITILAPAHITKHYQIPYLSLGSDLGRREIIYEGCSTISGPLVVEDVYTYDQIFRRLIFLNTQALIQSEVKMISKSNETKLCVQNGWLGCDYHKYIAVGVEILNSNQNNISAVIVGLGGGGLCTFLQQTQQLIRLKAVDIDPLVLEIAQNWFELKLDHKLSVDIIDGIEFIHNEVNNGHKHHIIIFDINNSDPSSELSGPPLCFLDEPLLCTVKKCLTKKGMLIINLVCRNKSTTDTILNRLKSIFEMVASYQLETDQNSVIYCWQNKNRTDWDNHFRMASIRLNKFCKQMLNDDEFINVNQFIDQLQMH